MNNILKLYFIMGSTNTNGRDPLAVLESVLKAGITCFQFREKGEAALRGEEKYQFAKQCKDLCDQYDVPFIVNDDVKLALALDADGIHIGQEDEEATKVRRLIGPNKILGVSAHNLEEATKAKEAGADYVGMGPVYATQSKADAQSPAGTKKIKEVTRFYPELPVVGIGGITLENFHPVIEAGASGVAVISALASAENPTEATKNFLFKINETLERRIKYEY